MTAIFEDISLSKAIDAIATFSDEFDRESWEAESQTNSTLKFKHQSWLMFTYFIKSKKLVMQGTEQVIEENRQINEQMLNKSWTNLLNRSNKRTKQDQHDNGKPKRSFTII